MATLVVNRAESRCDECGKNAMPYQETHDQVYGYTPGPGCGAVFTHIRSDYFGLNMEQWAKDNRPDLIWNGMDESKYI